MDVEIPDRALVSEALVRQLSAGEKFADPDAEIDVDQLLGWGQRIHGLAKDLADCVRAPMRNRVIETLQLPSVPDDANALMLFRLNILGMSDRALAEDLDVSAPTISRLQSPDGGCNVGTAKKVADRFALTVTEMFDHEDEDVRGLQVRTAAGLRHELELD